MDRKKGNLGNRIREIRKERGYTIKLMSEYTGLSVGYLSTVEQGKTSLTINNLMQICETLRVDPAWLLTSEKENKMIVRKEETRTELFPDSKQKLEIIDFGYSHQMYEYITIEPGVSAQDEQFRHLYDEMGTVVKGVLSVEVEGEIFRLKEGDSIYIRTNQLHRIFNEEDGECVSFWVYQIEGR